MKRHTRDVIRSLVRLVDDDVTELRDAVVQIDEREARNARRFMDAYSELHERVTAIERRAGIDAAGHSRKVTCLMFVGFQGGGHHCATCGVEWSVHP